MNITDATNIPEGEYLLVCKTSRNVYYLVTNTTGIVQGANGILQYEIGKSASYIVGDYALSSDRIDKEKQPAEKDYDYDILEKLEKELHIGMMSNLNVAVRPVDERYSSNPCITSLTIRIYP